MALTKQRAKRSAVYLKMNISGPSGSGKTMSALLMAYGMTGDWTKIALIDSENKSASLYDHIGPFEVVNLEPPFSPETYIEAIDLCLKDGSQVIIIDSSTHEWSGPGGCLEINEALAKTRFKGNTWSAWSETTPRHEKFLQKVLQCNAHVITCTRSKTETVMDEQTKKVKKVGMKDVQRDGWEYELTVSLNLDRDTHFATPSKDRTNVFEKRDPFIITEKTGREIKAWCENTDYNAAAAAAADIKAAERAKLQPCTDKAVKSAIARYANGELDVFDKLKLAFNLNPSQEEMINLAIKK